MARATVANLFVARGADLVDTDAIAHELTGAEGAAMPALVAEVGGEILAVDGSLNRPVLREKVFSDPLAKARLEGILHDRAERFLGLAALLSVVLAAVAVAMASRRYLQRHLDACALMRCFGLSQRRLLALHALQFGWLALFAALVGALVGFAAHHVLIGALGRLLAVALPPTQGLPVMHGVAVAFVLLFGFALPPLLQLARVPTLRVLRRDLGTASGSQRLAFILGFGLLAALIVVVAGDTRLGLIAAGGFFVALLVFWGLARGGIALLGAVRGGAGAGWFYRLSYD